MDHAQYQRPTAITTGDDFDLAEIPPTKIELPPLATVADIQRLEALLAQQITWLERIAVMIRAERAERPINRVKIEDINMPFWHMVGLIVKFNLASSPIIVVLAGLTILAVGLCGGATLLAALGAVLRR